MSIYEHKRFWIAAALLAGLALTGCANRKNAASASGADGSAEPDKVLFERATDDIKHSRYATGRLSLQTLINTYPDSEYLAKAKLAIADSYYKEGGTSGLTQAVAEYQDFITFFPFLDEAAYAQMQIGMAHYHEMEKPDRDRNEAEQAEAALQTFLQKYPNNPLYGQAQQQLRDVQEVLAEGDFRIGYFYYFRRADRASVARLTELTNRYPLYSQADRANWMLADAYERNEHSDIAAQFYARIVKDYPLSPLATDAKAKLVKLNLPVPEADPTALARMQKEQQTPHPRVGIVARSMGMLKTGPDVKMAARVGDPNLAPPDDPNTETLKIGGATTLGGSSPASSGAISGALVETVTPGSSGSVAPSAPTPPAPSAASDTNATASASSDTAASPGQTTDASTSDSGSTTAATNGSPAQSNQKESSSKKKKGIHKIIPF